MPALFSEAALMNPGAESRCEPENYFRLMWLWAKSWHELYKRSQCYSPGIIFPEILFADMHITFSYGSQWWRRDIRHSFHWGSCMQPLMMSFSLMLTKLCTSFAFSGGLLYIFLPCYSSKKHFSCSFTLTHLPGLTLSVSSKGIQYSCGLANCLALHNMLHALCRLWRWFIVYNCSC